MITQNVQGCKRSDKLECIVDRMSERMISSFCVQETWMLGNFAKEINGILMLHHNSKTKLNKMGRSPRGVAILLNSEFIKAYKKAGSIAPVYMPNEEFEGRFIRIPLILNNYDDYGKKIKGTTKIFLTSIYHPVEPKEQAAFNKVLATMWDKVPKNYQIINGQDINANVGVRKVDDPKKKVIGPNGLDNQNMKGKKLLDVLISKNLRVVNSYLKKKIYGTWKEIKTGSMHMLDVFSASIDVCKRIKDCGRVTYGVDGDHYAVMMKFHLNTIAFKNVLAKGSADYKTIKEEECKTFNDGVWERGKDEKYTKCMETINIVAEETCMKTKYVINGWYKFGGEELRKATEERDKMRSEMREREGKVNNSDCPLLKEANKRVKDVIDNAHAKYERSKAEKVHKMAEDGKGGWVAANEMMAGDSGHHVKPKTMAMKMENGKLSTNDKEHMSVFYPHFNKLLIAGSTKYAKAAEYIKQREMCPELDRDIEWAEFTRAIGALKNDKAPGLNGVPPDALKCMDERNLSKVFEFICDLWNGKADYEEWKECQLVLIPKNG